MLATASLIVATSITVSGQLVIVDKSKVANCNGNMQNTIVSDIGLTSYQKSKIADLDAMYLDKVLDIESKYKVNSDIYLNKIRLNHERHVVALRDYMTLEQYAIYLNNNRDQQYYDSEYKDDRMELKREADGDVYFEDKTGEICLEDDKIIIDNNFNETYLKVTESKIIFEDDKNDKKVKITEDRVVVKENGKKEVIEKDEASFESDFIEIEIDDVETVSQK